MSVKGYRHANEGIKDKKKRTEVLAGQQLGRRMSGAAALGGNVGGKRIS